MDWIAEYDPRSYFATGHTENPFLKLSYISYSEYLPMNTNQPAEY